MSGGLFDAAETGRKIEDDTFDAAEARLRLALLDAQFEQRDRAAFAAHVLLAGFESSGRGATAQRLVSWMDARLIATAAYPAPSADEQERPPMWRYWRDLAPAGETRLYFDAWYGEAFRALAAGEDAATVGARLDAINRFERMVAAEGGLLVKIWLHLSKAAQKRRLKTLEADAQTAWRVTKTDWKAYRRYDERRAWAETVLRATNHAAAPWIIVEAEDDKTSDAAVGEALVAALRCRLDAPDDARPPAVHAPERIGRRRLDHVDAPPALKKSDYAERLAAAQGRIAIASRKLAKAGRAAVFVFEGADAAGKGGAIRRATAAMDPRLYRVYPVAAPNDDERARPYLWRFWRRIPPRGRVAVFDRSWYGRVLVERVEGFVDAGAWMRAYDEINGFEAELADADVTVLKFWLNLSADAQLRRFEARAETAHKRFKLTPEDWRNRGKWDAYIEAASDMLDRTDAPHAPWVVVPADDKRSARVQVAEAVADALDAATKKRKR